MNDQASLLRASRREAVRPVASPGGDPDCPAIVIGSGKGGVGKSLLAIGLSVSLARAGHRVLLVDGAQNLGNLHVLLGVRPVLTPEALLDDSTVPTQLLMEVAPRLWLLPADSGAESIHRLGATDRARLHHRMTGVYRDFDVVIVDSAAGIDGAVRCVAMRASRLLVVTMPEPAALTDGYALMKIVHGRMPRLPFDVLVNRVRDPEEGTTAFSRLDTAARRFLGHGLQYVGALPEDPDMRTLARDPRALLDPGTGTASQVAIEGIVSAWQDLWLARREECA